MVGFARPSRRRVLLFVDEPPLALPFLERGGEGLEVEVVRSGPVRATAAVQPFAPRTWAARRIRPLRAGSSLGTSRRTGTLGLVCTPRTGPARPLLLTAAHLFGPRGTRRTALQPAGPDGGSSRRDGVGEVLRSARLGDRSPRRMDAAVVKAMAGLEVEVDYGSRRSLAGHCLRVRPGWRLWKVGRATGPVEGSVVATNWTGWVEYAFGRRRLVEQVLVHNPDRPVALEGDSGSVWVTEDGHAAALSFSATARDGHYSIATPLARILDAFGLAVAVRPSED